MAANTAAADELLARYVEEVKRVDAAGSVNFVACTDVDPAEMAGLLPLVDEVHQALRSEMPCLVSEAAARRRLLREIQADIAISRQPEAPPAPLRARPRFRIPTWNHGTAMAMALLILCSIAALAWYGIWKQYTYTCSPPALAVALPTVTATPVARPPAGEKCLETPAVKPAGL